MSTEHRDVLVGAITSVLPAVIHPTQARKIAERAAHRVEVIVDGWEGNAAFELRRAFDAVHPGYGSAMAGEMAEGIIAEHDRLTAEHGAAVALLYEDPRKWSWDVVLDVADLILDTHYPAETFVGGDHQDVGVRVVVRLREAVQQARAVGPLDDGLGKS